MVVVSERCFFFFDNVDSLTRIFIYASRFSGSIFFY